MVETAEELIEEIRRKNRRALARAITHIENRTGIGEDLRRGLGYVQSSSHVIGVTGSPGTGKSTLVNSLVRYFRSADETVGVIAVDPTSPFTDGAILGDRIRMLQSTSDSEVYIRSMASRGHLGGLSIVTFDVLNLYRLYGFDRIVIETVGAGQSEVDVMRYCDTTVVVVVPGLGDGVQALKAGILEIADVFAVNKADLEGATQVANQIRNVLNLVSHERSWSPPVLLISALLNEGVEELVGSLNTHREHIRASEVHVEKVREQVQNAILDELTERMRAAYLKSRRFQEVVDKILSGGLSIGDGVSVLTGDE